MTGGRLSIEEVNYWKKWQNNRDQHAGDYLVEKYLPLVDYVIQRLMMSMPKSVDKDEIRSLAFEGLLDALNKFSLQRDIKFETYATWRIKGAIIDGLRQRDWLPRSVRDKVKKIEEAYKVLEQKKNGSVTDEEVCDYLGISKVDLNKAVSDAALSSIISIDETTHDDDQEQVGRYNMITNEHAVSPEKHLSDQLLKDALANAIDRLPEKEKLVVTLAYFEELKMKEIADVLNVSVSRVSQLHSRAMLRLNNAFLTIYDTY